MLGGAFVQILDSRGNPTIRGAYRGTIIGVPSGASTGIHEAKEMRDGGEGYEGKEVLMAVRNANDLSRELCWEPADYNKADAFIREKDGSKDKSRLGANALLAVSMLQAKVQAKQEGKELYQLISEKSGNHACLPTPYANIINGGRHAGNKLQLQEFMVVPKAKSFYEATKIVADTYHTLKSIIEDKYGRAQTGLGDEGGFAPDISTTQEAIELILEAAKKAGHEVSIAIDAAASEIRQSGVYHVSEHEQYTSNEMIDWYMDLLERYPIISLEDPFDQDDFTSFSKLRKKIEEADIDCQIVGDDLTVTNPERIQMAIKNKSCTCLLLKLNQIGTVTEALEAANMVRDAGWSVMVSHRSGETTDDFIADLATGLGTGQIKLGAPARGERTAKYNRLLELEALKGLALRNNI